MPVRNGLPYLAEAVASIRAQSLLDWELVVVDNGSSDGSAEYIAQQQRSDPRIRLVHNETVGVAHSLNYGLDHCRAPWVARMDADDRSWPARFERQLAFLQTYPDVVGVSCWAYYINATGRRIARAPNDLTTHEAFERRMSRPAPIELPHPGAFIAREALERIGRYRPEFDPAEDVDLWSRLAERGVVLAVPEFLLDYRLHAGSVVSTHLRLAHMKREWAWNCALARRRGLSEPAWHDFQRAWQGAPPLRRLHRERRLLADRLFRVGREDLASGARFRGMARISAGTLLRPMHAMPRLRRQVELSLMRVSPFGRAA